MMTHQPSRVTPAEICDLLRSMAGLSHDTPLGEQIAWHERKAALLSRIAADRDTPTRITPRPRRGISSPLWPLGSATRCRERGNGCEPVAVFG